MGGNGREGDLCVPDALLQKGGKKLAKCCTGDVAQMDTSMWGA